MTHLLNIPENVMIQQLFPYLDHNDLLRLRRVSKPTKALAEAYLWTPQPGHQGNWELKIDSGKEDQTLQAFLKLGLPPPSRLHIANIAEKAPSEPRSFFEDERLEEFMERYGKYVTHLRLDKLFLPFTSAKEIGFYESLVKLEELRCKEMITVGGAAQFEEKTKNAAGSFLIRPTFKKLKVFKLDYTYCMDLMWNFINGLSNNLEELRHPFEWGYGVRQLFNRTNFGPVQQLIERRGVRNQCKLVYDWRYLFVTGDMSYYLELLRIFASCRDNGVFVKNLDASYLDCLLCDENGRIPHIYEAVNLLELIVNLRLNFQRNMFVRNVIHSLVGGRDNALLLEMPALEEIGISREDCFQIDRMRGVGYPQWPSLRKMHVNLDYCSRHHVPFLLRTVQRPKLEELSLANARMKNLPYLCGLGNCCGNLKKLSISCPGDNDFFLALWEGLPLLEDVSLYDCGKLTNKGFVGDPVAGGRPAFLKLEKLKHLTIRGLDRMPRLTNTLFKKVFRHLKLSSFKLSSRSAIKSITVAGIKELLAGSFAETIQKLDLDQLSLENASKEELKQVVTCFRSSKML